MKALGAILATILPILLVGLVAWFSDWISRRDK